MMYNRYGYKILPAAEASSTPQASATTPLSSHCTSSLNDKDDDNKCAYQRQNNKRKFVDCTPRQGISSDPSNEHEKCQGTDARQTTTVPTKTATDGQISWDFDRDDDTAPLMLRPSADQIESSSLAENRLEGVIKTLRWAAEDEEILPNCTVFSFTIQENIPVSATLSRRLVPNALLAALNSSGLLEEPIIHTACSVDGVTPNGPADMAGIRPSDWLLLDTASSSPDSTTPRFQASFDTICSRFKSGARPMTLLVIRYCPDRQVASSKRACRPSPSHTLLMDRNKHRQNTMVAAPSTKSSRTRLFAMEHTASVHVNHELAEMDIFRATSATTTTSPTSVHTSSNSKKHKVTPCTDDHRAPALENQDEECLSDDDHAFRYAIGTRLVKLFQDFGIFEGIVKDFDEELQCYLVEYKDGDCEHLSTQDIQTLIRENELLIIR